ncbi:ABC transporter permease [Bacillus sp. CH30_1T]|uniref:ABC transporter permease n=1 Tax=Bacillus sp. CH30_1T TaxID=2604836 RepID=UPI0011EFC0DB|nr:ABC transporter permease [Bacillus sp. CH30_1T]KAA0560855.1 ABC transporter permease [Bacillus sp. CH30_1T]
MGIWNIATKDLRIFIRDIPGLLYLILTPVIIIAIASFALSGMFTEGEVEQFSIPIVIEDDGEVAENLVSVLDETSAIKLIETYKTSDGEEANLTREEAENMIADKKAAIIIPNGFSEKVKNGENAEIIVLKDPVDRVIPGVVNDILSQYTAKLSMVNVVNLIGSTAVLNITQQTQQVHGISIDPSAEIETIKEQSEYYTDHPPVKVVVETSETKEVEHEATPFESNVPGYAVMFVLLGTAAGATSLLEERDRGTLRKLQTLPISRFSILGGKMLSNFLTALFQMLVLFTVGHFIFGMWLGNSITGLILLVIATAFAATGLAMFIASICKTRAQASGVSLLIVLSMSALGGSWWPLYIVPEWLQKVAHVTLTAWSMSAFNNLLIYGEGLSTIIASIVVLFGMGILFLILSVRLFKFN